jgi:DNA-binding response OmpR family regulator
MRLLIVEDEVGIANFLKQGLEEESFAVDVCHTGNEGLALALSGEYDLLILDWMLPGKSGIDFLYRVQKIVQIGSGDFSHGQRHAQ